VSLFLGFLMACALGFWAYLDAKRFETAGVRVGPFSAVAWGWAVMLFALIFGIWYLVARPRAVAALRTGAVTAPIVRETAPTVPPPYTGTRRFCAKCGSDLPPEARFCPQCAHPVKAPLA
jgi:hypothetical protein